jgi:hypothetical protein
VKTQTVSVFSTPLDSSADLVAPNMDEFLGEQEEQQAPKRAKKDTD